MLPNGTTSVDIRSATYEYEPIGDDDIRLLALYPAEEGNQDSPLRGQLKTFRLTPAIESQQDSSDDEVDGDQPDGAEPPLGTQNPEAPVYEALSYTWGGEAEPGITPEPRLEIFEWTPYSHSGSGLVEQSMRPKEMGHFQLTQNLNEALRTFRAELKPDDGPLVFWIDAICIWQDGGHHEKAAQIRKMADIYAEAKNVRVWLGQGNESKVDVHGFIKQILTLERFDKTARAKEKVNEWKALKSLMQSSWFQRRWVVQEIAFARKATVHWGTVVMPWTELASAVQLFASKIKTLRQVFHEAKEAHHNPDYIGEIEAYGAKNLVDALDRMLRRSQDGDIMELLLSLENILTTMTAFEVARPHDTLYAVLQLSKDALPAADRTIVPKTAANSPRRGRSPNDVQLPIINEPVDQRGPRFSESPERIDLPSKTPQDDTLNSSSEWAQRGRGTARRGSAVHLAVRYEDNFMSRSRSRSRSKSRARNLSPAAVRSIAQKHYLRPRKKFKIDYDKSILKLCTEVIDFVTVQSQSLDIICKPWAPDVRPTERKKSKHYEDRHPYPSWIQPLSKRVFGMERAAGNQRSSRTGPDSLAGSQIPGYKTYNASDIVPPELPPGTPLIQGRILNAKGFVLDTVVKVSSPAHNAIIPYGWLELEWTDKTNPSVESLPPERFWRTLVANRESSNSPSGPPLYWRQACQWAFNQRNSSSNLDITSLMQNLSDVVSQALGDFLHRVRSVVWDRVLIRTKGSKGKSGFLGLAPKETQEGDLICILYGCSVPVVLRRKDKERRRRERIANRPRVSGRTKRRGTFQDPHEGTIKFPASSSAGSLRQTSPLSSTSTDINEIRSANGMTSDLGADVNGYEITPEDPHLEEYALIGECYIHGMMDGEALSRERERSEQQDLKNSHSANASAERYANNGHLDEPDDWVEQTFRLGCCFDCTCPRCY